MLKRLAVGTALAVALVGSTGGAALADNNGRGNGAVGCTLSGGAQYANPAAMLKALAVRDGSFQNTVDKYSGSFSSVGDLVGQKCGA